MACLCICLLVTTGIGQIRLGESVVNDDCADSLPIYDGDTFYDTIHATTDGPAHAACQVDGQTYNDIWFNYTATGTGDLTVSTCNTAAYDTDLVLYDGCACPVDDGRMLACNDDALGCEGYTSIVETPVVAGACYKVRVGGFLDDSFGTGTVRVSIDPFDPACLSSDEPCFTSHVTPGCADAICCDAVCAIDAYCCEVEWDVNCFDAAGSVCAGLGACCTLDGPCLEMAPEAECDGTWHVGQSCQSVTCGGPPPFSTSSPVDQQSLWRAGRNHLTLRFAGALASPPSPGEVSVQVMLPGGAYGPDLSAAFQFEIADRTLSMTEVESVLEHRQWYAIRNMGWDAAGPFRIRLVVQVGDATGDGRVLPGDLSFVNTRMPSFGVPVSDRFDINGDGRILPNDLSLTNVHMPSLEVAKPLGHD